MAGRDETADVIPSGIGSARLLHSPRDRAGLPHLRFPARRRALQIFVRSQGHDHQLPVGANRRRAGISASDWTPGPWAPCFGRRPSFITANELAKAEAAYRQILQVDPVHARTLYVLGQLLSTKGDHWEAAKTYEALAAVAPTSVKVWSRLAGAYQALDRHSEAASAFRKALELKPGLAQAQDGLGRSLVELQRTEKAAHALSALQRRLQQLGASGSSYERDNATSGTQPGRAALFHYAEAGEINFAGSRAFHVVVGAPKLHRRSCACLGQDASSVENPGSANCRPSLFSGRIASAKGYTVSIRRLYWQGARSLRRRQSRNALTR